MLKKAFKVILLLMFVYPAFSQPQDNDNKRYDLYLLIGESNMAGRGYIEEQDQIPLDKVYSLNKQMIWVRAADPVHFDKPNAGAGLARSFGIEMSQNYPNSLIGLIPCAVGGTSIDHWEPGVMHERTISYPWDNMIKRLRFAMQYGELKGILWHQGEADSNPEKCFEYKQKLMALVNRIRAEAKNENIPFVVGELGKFFIKKNKEEHPEMRTPPATIVIKNTKEVVREFPKMGFVMSNGLESDGGNVHFNSESYRELGFRYAKTMIRVQNRK